MAQLRLAFLGEPAVYLAGERVTFATRKAAALLIYLAVEEGWHSREKLAVLLWPDKNASRGRGSLRMALGFLRQALRPAPSTEASHLLLDNDRVAFDLGESGEMDLRLLQTAVASSLNTPSLAQLTAAVALYRGDFLTGFSLGDAAEFDGWASRQRESYHRQFSLVLSQLGQQQTAVGQPQAAIETAVRWVAHDPLSEAAYRALMQAYWLKGERDAALRTYQTCQEVLATELALQPDAETQNLAARIRAARQTAVVPNQYVGATSPPPARPKLLETPFVGRTSEYASLVAAYQAARVGQTQLIVLEGEAGIGKTRLAQRFLAWTAVEGADIIQGRAFEVSGRLPYQPLIEALRSRVEQENAPDDLLNDVWLSELSRLLPELRDRYPDLPLPSSDGTSARTQLLEAVARLVEALAQRQPLLLFIDDGQWADAASLDLLHYTARYSAQQAVPLLLLLTIRSEALAASPTLRQWLTGLKRDLPLTHLALPPLNTAETQALVWQLTGTNEQSHGESSPQATFAHWLFAETQGQPFFLAETLKALLEQGHVVAHEAAGGGWRLDLTSAELLKLPSLLPPTVRELIRARLAPLNPTAVALATAAAVLGQRLRFEQLCQVAAVDEDSSLVALDALLAGHILQTANPSQPHQAPFYLFTHDKIRDVVYTEAGDARRRVFHRRALAALQPTPAPAAELARHALAAGQTHVAGRYSRAAGDEAMALFATQDAIFHYQRAQQLLDEPDPSETTGLDDLAGLKRHLYGQLIRAHELEGSYSQAKVLGHELLAYARQKENVALEGVALNQLAILAAQAVDYTAAADFLQQALLAAEKSNDRETIAETTWGLAQIGFYHWDPAMALTHGRRALALAEELQRPLLIARALNVLACARLVAGDWAETAVYAAAAQEQYAALGNRAMVADSLTMVAIGQLHRGQGAAAAQAAQAAYTISQAIGNPWGQASSSIHLALALLEQGQDAAALGYAKEGVHLTHTYNLGNYLALSQAALATVNRTLGALDQAQVILQETLAHILPPPLLGMVTAELATVYALRGDWEAAAAATRQTLPARHYPLYIIGMARWQQTEALLRAGEEQLAREDVAQFARLIGDNPRYALVYERCRAVLAAWEGATAVATAHLQTALTIAQQLHLPGEQHSILRQRPFIAR